MMMRLKSKKIAVLFLMIAVFGVLVYLLVEIINLNKTVQGLEQDLDKAEKTGTLLKRKYAEEKSRAAAMQRAKLFAEGQLRQAEQKTEALQAKLDDIETIQGEALKRCEAKTAKANGEIDRLKKAIEKWRESYAERTEMLKETMAKLKETGAENERRGEKIAELESDLEHENRRNERYLGQNKKMAEISQSILAKYDNKAVFRSLQFVEPFTKLKQVELEKIIQDYLDELDATVIRESQ
jgi:chromosome segregation ATPase